MIWLKQMARVVYVGIKTIPKRRTSAIVTVVGVTGVVAVLVSVLSIAEGFRQTLLNGVSDRNVIVTSKRATSELTSFIRNENAKIVMNLPGLAKDSKGNTLVSGERYSIVNLDKRDSEGTGNVPMRGIGLQAVHMHEKFSLVEGRMFKSGHKEVIAGIGIASKFNNLDVGNKLTIGQDEWLVVGVFEVGGGVAESELWVDANVVPMSNSAFSSIYARLQSINHFNEFKAAVYSDPRLSVKVMRETDYYAEQSELMQTFITVIGYSIAILMAIGAVFASINATLSSVSRRKQEIVILKTLGFGTSPIIMSVLAENLLLSFVGAILGAGAAYLLFNGMNVSTLNMSGSFSQVVFSFVVTQGLLFKGIILSLIIGFISATFPAIKVATGPVVGGGR